MDGGPRSAGNGGAVVSGHRESLCCPECDAPFDLLILYLDPDGPYYGCGECGWIEPHGPGVWTAEKIADVLNGGAA
jgi:hypothetical protein